MGFLPVDTRANAPKHGAPLYLHYMSSVQKLPHSPNWIAYFRGPDGKQRAKSTGLPATPENKLKALRFAEMLEVGSRSAEDLDQMRAAFESLAQEIGRETDAALTIRDYFNRALVTLMDGLAPSMMLKNRSRLDQFLHWLGDRADLPMRKLSGEMLKDYRVHMQERLRASSANLHLSFVFRAAQLALREGVIFRDPTAGVKLLRVPAMRSRRPFTVEEMRQILSSATGEWRGIVLAGFYTGQRIGDIVRMEWSAIEPDGDRLRWSFVTGKTGRRQSIPLHHTLAAFLTSLPREGRFVFPGLSRNVSPSAQFRDVLLAAGLSGSKQDAHAAILARAYGLTTSAIFKWRRFGTPDDPCPVSRPAEMREWIRRRMKRTPHRTTLEGIAAASARFPDGIPLPEYSPRRNIYALSFHSLRHTATSMLRSAGASLAVSMDIIGHSSAQVHSVYTHTELAERRAAVDSLPEI